MTKHHSCCFPLKVTQDAGVDCPSCGCTWQPVNALTLRALLRSELVEQFQDVTYRYCATTTCPVVYYAPGGPQTGAGEPGHQ